MKWLVINQIYYYYLGEFDDEAGARASYEAHVADKRDQYGVEARGPSPGWPDSDEVFLCQIVDHYEPPPHTDR